MPGLHALCAPCLQAQAVSGGRADDVRAVTAATEHILASCRMRLQATRYLQQARAEGLRASQFELEAAAKQKDSTAALTASKQLQEVRPCMFTPGCLPA